MVQKKQRTGYHTVEQKSEKKSVSHPKNPTPYNTIHYKINHFQT
jgi:hypothetical protein